MRKLMLINTAAPLAFMAETGAAKAPRVEPVIVGLNLDIPMPIRAKRGSEPKYPFDGLEVGKCFGVKNKTAKDMGSVISAANRRYNKPVLNEQGQPTYAMKNAQSPEGVEMSVPDLTKPIKNAERHFFAVDATPEQIKSWKGTENEGIKVLVYRDK